MPDQNLHGLIVSMVLALCLLPVLCWLVRRVARYESAKLSKLWKASSITQILFAGDHIAVEKMIRAFSRSVGTSFEVIADAPERLAADQLLIWHVARDQDISQAVARGAALGFGVVILTTRPQSKQAGPLPPNTRILTYPFVGGPFVGNSFFSQLVATANALQSRA